jgi:hypothetical protein
MLVFSSFPHRREFGDSGLFSNVQVRILAGAGMMPLYTFSELYMFQQGMAHQAPHCVLPERDYPPIRFYRHKQTGFNRMQSVSDTSRAMPSENQSPLSDGIV